MKGIVGDGVEGCDGDDGVGKSSGLELRSWRSRDMEMYPQKRFAPGRRRINAAHHVLTQPIGTFFPRYACFCTFVFQMSRAPQGNLYFCGWFYKLQLSRAQTKGHPVRGQSNVASGIKITTQTKRSSPVLEAQQRLGRISNIRAPTKLCFERQISTPKTNSLGVEIPIYTSTFLILSATMR
jgi:hypothetical protein